MIGMNCVNQQARRDLISRLSDLRSQYNLFDENEQGAYHTLTEAIAVLNGVNESAWPTQPNTPNTLKALDCVVRQDAIDVIDAVFPVDPMKSEYAQGIACGAALAKTYVEQLPSAQPEQRPLTEDDYAYCAECDHVEMCRWYPMYGCVFRSRPSAQPEIIRCKDCKHWDGVDTCDVIDAPVWDNDFCSMAERRTDE